MKAIKEMTSNDTELSHIDNKCDNDISTGDFNKFELCTDDGSDTHYNNDVRAAEPYQFEPISCRTCKNTSRPALQSIMSITNLT